MVELVQIFDSGVCGPDTPNREEKAFVRNAAIAIEDSLKRKFNVEDIVERYKTDNWCIILEGSQFTFIIN